MVKLISHAQALFAKPADFVGEYDPTYEVISQTNVVNENRVQKKTSVVLRDNREEMSKYNVSDFYLENLAAVGALQDSKRYTLNPSTMDMMDAVDGAVDILNDFADQFASVENKQDE